MWNCCKVCDVLQAYHMKSGYCYNKRSISLCFQMPNRTAPKCWNYVEVELEKNVMIHSTVHRKVLSLTIHIADFDWTLIYTGTRAFVHTWEHWNSSSAEDNFNFAQPIFFFTGVDFCPSSHCLMIITCMWSWIQTQSKCCHNKMLHFQSNPVFFIII